MLNHTQQGTFGDPYYGGNANFVGWDLLGYPGIRTMVSAAEQQQLEKHALKPNHKSADDYELVHQGVGAEPAAPTPGEGRGVGHGDQARRTPTS